MVVHGRPARWRVKARRGWQLALTAYFESPAVQTLVLLVGLGSCVTYVVQVSGGMGNVVGLDFFYFVVFAVDYALCLANAPRKFDYVFSWIGIADLASMVPIVGDLVGLTGSNLHSFDPWLGFLRFFRLLQVFHLFRLRDALAPVLASHDAVFSLSVSEINFQAARLAITIIAFFFMATGAVYAVASNDPGSFNHELTWFDSFYFTIVSVTTVGYGDITAASELAKVVTIVVIVVGFSLIPAQVAALVSTILSQVSTMIKRFQATRAVRSPSPSPNLPAHWRCLPIVDTLSSAESSITSSCSASSARCFTRHTWPPRSGPT